MLLKLRQSPKNYYRSVEIALTQGLTPQKKLGKSIRLARIAMDLSQTALAVQLNCSQYLISAYERGESVPDYLMMQAIARVLQQPLEYFES